MEPDANDPMYQSWIEECAKECAKECTCCPDCQDVPCDSLLAGGLCDNYCNCSDDPDDVD